MHKHTLCTLILLALLLAAAAPAASAAPFATVTDSFGYTIDIPAQPERIISLAPTNTEILFALGLGSKVIGVTEYCNYPAETADIEKVGGFSTVNIEKVVALNPDVVFASDGNTKDVVDHLKTLGLTVVTIKDPASLAETYGDIQLIGSAAGATAAAETLVADIQKQVTAVKTQTAGLTQPSVVHIVWHDPIMVSAGQTFQDEMITTAGGTNAFANETGWATISLERFLTVNPDIILVSGNHGSENVSRDNIINDPRFSSVNAVKNGQVIVMDTDLLSRAGPRIGTAIEQIAAAIHPDAATAAPTAAAQTPGFTILPILAGLICSGYILRTRR